MTVLKATAIDSALTKKGFRRIEERKHIFYQLLNSDGKKTAVRTMMSHNGQEVSGNLLSNMAKQTKLTKDQFIKLIQCTLSKDDYYKILNI